MTEKQKVLMSWSGGKDSAMALLEILRSEKHEVVALLTSVAKEYGRISHHGVREELLEIQAAAIGIPLDKLVLPASDSHPCTHSAYDELMKDAMLRYKDKGVSSVVFGDIFLEDLRKYREANLAKVGMTGLFPLWKRDTAILAQHWMDLGFKAYVCCVEGKLGEAFVGRSLDSDFFRDLPDGIDPCGEYGEYHSFVYQGPIFRYPIDVELGEVVLRDTRYYVDLLPRKRPETSPDSLPDAVIPHV